MNILLGRMGSGLHATGNGEVMGDKSENCKSDFAIIIFSANSLLFSPLRSKEQGIEHT